MNRQGIYEDVLKQGVRTYKYKNSVIKPIGYTNQNGNGAIFAFRSKERMNTSRGIVITSEEGISENSGALSHWTPNVYRYGTYADSCRTIVKGHSEGNLSQINTFTVDIDTKEKHEGEIILACMDQLGFIPTMILETDKGYQAFFFLKTPAYVTVKSNFKVIKVAKMISTTIRTKLAEVLPGIDVGCNHFGISRFPTKDNTVFYDKEYQYPFSDWLNWSIKQSDSDKQEQKNKQKVIAFPEQNKIRQVDEPWFDLLLRSAKIIGTKGILGRNNVIFTLSLAYYSSSYSLETCEYNIFEFNDRLQEPLEDNELKKIIKSAYSGNYQGAQKEFILSLCKEWISESIQEKDLFIKRRGWWKFKKPREQRTYSHLREWKEDLMAYLSEKSYVYKPYLATTKKELHEELAIPERTLDKLLKELKATNQIFYRIKRGRNGGVVVASIKALFTTIIRVKKEVKEAYYDALSEAFGLKGTNIQMAFKQLFSDKSTVEQVDLFEADTG